MEWATTCAWQARGCRVIDTVVTNIAALRPHSMCIQARHGVRHHLCVAVAGQDEYKQHCEVKMSAAQPSVG